jgi:hypothetical protein
MACVYPGSGPHDGRAEDPKAQPEPFIIVAGKRTRAMPIMLPGMPTRPPLRPAPQGRPPGWGHCWQGPQPLVEDASSVGDEGGRERPPRTLFMPQRMRRMRGRLVPSTPPRVD